MKFCTIIAVIFATAFSSVADFTNSPENFSPHFSTRTEILWRAQTNALPKSFWIYKRLPSKSFSATVISNAIVLASLQTKGFPKPSTNDFFIWEEKGPNYPRAIADIFCITPKSGTISYWLPNADTNTADIPANEILAKRAWDCAMQLGVDPAQVAFKEMTSRFNQDENYNDLTNQLCGRGIFLSRKLDGLLFWSIGTEDGSYDGFWIEFGSHGRVHAFSLVWPDLKRSELGQIATPEEIIACIKAQKTIVIPNRSEGNYFRESKRWRPQKNLPSRKSLRITSKADLEKRRRTTYRQKLSSRLPTWKPSQISGAATQASD